MPWKIENYYILNGRVLNVEVSIPLRKFLYINIDDVKNAWTEMLEQFVKEEPELEMSWEIEPKEDIALVTIRIAKKGELAYFTKEEVKETLSATDALFSEKKTKMKSKTKKQTTKKKKSAK